MTFEERLSALFSNSGREQKALAAELGLTPSALTDYKKGRGKPSMDVLIRMAVLFKVSLDWLILGKGNLQSDYVSSVSEPYGLSPLIQKIRRLPPDQQALIEQTVDAWLASSEAHRKHSSG